MKKPQDDIDTLEKFLPVEESSPPPGAKLEWEIATSEVDLARFEQDNKRHAKNMRKLMGRKLDKEIALLYQFFSLGKDSARLRMDYAEATRVKFRLYYARAQERLRNPEGSQVLDGLSFYIGEDDKGGFLEIRVRPVLEFSLE